MTPTQLAAPTTERAPETRPAPRRTPRIYWYPAGRPDLATRMY